MVRNRIYYDIKPLLPARLRLALRRWFSRRKRAQVSDIWPIRPGSEKTPAGWPGWPEGKKFAFLITHDVEGRTGLERCRRLMDIEIKLGFRSSFNFIPEGEYTVPVGLRRDLAAAGFEVGVHDLKHDGKLYRAWEPFRENAVRINNYLKDWGSVGFRSGFMLHNLDWLHELNIAYDASTFDTDPFEPQPDGANTIFPFWVPRSASRNGSGSSNGLAGYVELPYTLTQDSTIFIHLGEKTPAIWLKKLEWLAQHGGMAMLPVHPDYMCFEGEPRGIYEYPVALYQDFLEEVARKYEGQYWQALPREVAAHCAPLYRNGAAKNLAVAGSLAGHTHGPDCSH